MGAERAEMEVSENDFVDLILDALYTAKRAQGLMPKLPEGFKPLHISVLRCIHKMCGSDGGVRVTDISRAMGAHAPNTTKLVNELVQFRAVRKSTLANDKRVVLVTLTPIGEQYVEDLVLQYHQILHTAFLEIGRERCLEMVETINKIYTAMRNIY